MKFLIIFYLVLQTFQLTAQSSKAHLTSIQNQIHVIIHQADPVSIKSKYQLTLTFSEVPSASYISFNSRDTVFKEHTVYRSFDFKIPSAKVGMQVDYSIDGIAGRDYSGVTRDYPVRKGDTVEFVLHKDSIVFLGKGSRRLNLQSEVFQIARPNLPKIPYNDPFYFDKKDSVYQTRLNSALRFIEDHKVALGNAYYNYLKAQVTGYRYFLRVKLISGSAIIDEALGARAARYHLAHPLNVKIPNEKNVDQASYFIDFLYQKERIDFEVLHPTRNFERKGGEIILNNIARKYSGPVRDRMLIVAFLHLSKSYLDVSSYFSTHKGLIPEHSPYYNIYKKICLAFDPQTPAYNFALQDSTGNIVRLADFKGKVVLLDFWFTGCRPCQILKDAMIPVFDKLKADKGLIFVTISIDQSRQGWINSIKAGQYTHPGSINLIAPGAKAPVLKYYNIISFPRLMLIDRTGKIISMKLPTPHTQEGKKELIETIEKALSNKKAAII